MELKLAINKSVEQNAEYYFDLAKKHKKKIPNIKKTIETARKKLEETQDEEKREVKVQRAKKEWYEKFRWFYSRGFLIIGGRDTTTNEIVIKKFTGPNDVVFHTELPGSPFVVIKNDSNQTIPPDVLEEAGIFCASFSKSWKAGRSTAQVYHVKPDQLTKEGRAGEHVPKGAFMVYGKRGYMNVPVSVAMLNDGRIMAGPLSAIKRLASEISLPYVELIQGSDKLSDVAKKIQKIIGGELDEIIRYLPPECSLKKVK